MITCKHSTEILLNKENYRIPGSENLEVVSNVAQFIKCSSCTIGSIKISEASNALQYLASFKDSRTGAKLKDVDVPSIIQQCNIMFDRLVTGFDEVEVTFKNYYAF